uniref:Uncharacterized protein n=1 Tax=Cannabis sativa TaxID=3483 RepID=A0A803QCD1_CANSA
MCRLEELPKKVPDVFIHMRKIAKTNACDLKTPIVPISVPQSLDQASQLHVRVTGHRYLQTRVSYKSLRRNHVETMRCKNPIHLETLTLVLMQGPNLLTENCFPYLCARWQSCSKIDPVMAVAERRPSVPSRSSGPPVRPGYVIVGGSGPF